MTKNDNNHNNNNNNNINNRNNNDNTVYYYLVFFRHSRLFKGTSAAIYDRTKCRFCVFFTKKLEGENEKK